MGGLIVVQKLGIGYVVRHRGGFVGIVEWEMTWL